MTDQVNRTVKGVSCEEVFRITHCVKVKFITTSSLSGAQIIRVHAVAMKLMISGLPFSSSRKEVAFVFAVGIIHNNHHFACLIRQLLVNRIKPSS